MVTRPAGRVICVTDRALLDPGVLEGARPGELKAARRLVRLERVGEQVVVRRLVHRVGATRIGRYVLTAPPTLPLRTFLAMVQIGYGLRPDQVPVGAMDRSPPPEMFRAAIGASLVAAAELVSRQHIHQAYEIRTERLQLIRGRPMWVQDIGRPPSGAATCRYELKTTDTPLNVLIVAGLIEARRLQPLGVLRRRAERQAFAWRGLADPPRSVSRSLFDTVRNRMTRQTSGPSRIWLG